MDNICTLAVVHTGDLIAMRQVLRAIDGDRLKGLISVSQAQVLVGKFPPPAVAASASLLGDRRFVLTPPRYFAATPPSCSPLGRSPSHSALAHVCAGKLLGSIQSTTMSMATKQAALDLIGEVALIAGTREMPSVVKSIIDVLEQTSDAAVHEKATSQLSKIFGSLPKSHPLVGSIISEVDAGLVSFQWNQRQRALTLFVIFANSMDLSTAISHSARRPNPLLEWRSL